MGTLFDSMPGLVMPVSEVTSRLSKMWADGSGGDYAHASEYRASQMNVVIHFGRATTQEEALECFNTALEFAKRYPCRIIVLCPEDKRKRDVHLEGKLFSQCYIDKTSRNFCCCECLILGYMPEPDYSLENQVSIWLESDLPTYYWLHRVQPGRLVESYLNFLLSCKRVIYDTSIEPEEYAYLPWPPSSVQDIAFARMLPVRQAMGHFLSTYEPNLLVEELKSVKIKHAPALAGEAAVLSAWQKRALTDCCERLELPFSVSLTSESNDRLSAAIEVSWKYTNKKYVTWCCHFEEGVITVEHALEGAVVKNKLPIKALKPEEVLAEAIFF